MKSTFASSCIGIGGELNASTRVGEIPASTQHLLKPCHIVSCSYSGIETSTPAMVEALMKTPEMHVQQIKNINSLLKLNERKEKLDGTGPKSQEMAQ